MRAILLLAIALLFLTPSVSLAQDNLDVWLLKLEKAECGMPKCADHFRILDTNGRYSYGPLQFQKATFEAQALKYGILHKLPTPDLLEASSYQEHLDMLVYASSTQHRVAREMFLHDMNAWYHWKNSVLKPSVGCPPTPTTCKIYTSSLIP